MFCQTRLGKHNHNIDFDLEKDLIITNNLNKYVFKFGIQKIYCLL